MRPGLALRRFVTHRVSAADKARARRALVAAAIDLLRLRVEDAWNHIDLAHETTRNAGVHHAAAHLARAVGMAARGRPRAALGELPLFVMATPIALARRAAGVGNDEPGGNGLRTTWRMRRRSDAVDPP